MSAWALAGCLRVVMRGGLFFSALVWAAPLMVVAESGRDGLAPWLANLPDGDVSVAQPLRGESLEAIAPILPIGIQDLVDRELVTVTGLRVPPRGFFDGIPRVKTGDVVAAAISDLASIPSAEILPFPAIPAEEGVTIRGRRLLMNVRWPLLREPYLEVELGVRVVTAREGNELRTVKLLLERASVVGGGVVAPRDQLFRERVRVVEPASLAHVAALSFQVATGEDAVWLKRIQGGGWVQLAGIVRGDPLVIGGIALDDLFGWSGRPEQSEVVASRAVIRGALIVPLRPPTIDGNGCTEYRLEGDAVQPVIVPRPSEELHRTTVQPFAHAGEERTVVDSELPFIWSRDLFDSVGVLQRSVTYGAGVIEHPTRGKMLFPVLMVIAGADGRLQSLTIAQRIRRCDKLPAEIEPLEPRSRELPPTPRSST